MALKRMDNVGIVVDDLDEAVEFFGELGLELEGRATIEGEWAGKVTGLGDQHVEVAMMRTPDGHSRLELSRFLAAGASSPITATPRSMRAGLSARHVRGGRSRRRRSSGWAIAPRSSTKWSSTRTSTGSATSAGRGGLLIGLAQELG